MNQRVTPRSERRLATVRLTSVARITVDRALDELHAGRIASLIEETLVSKGAK